MMIPHSSGCGCVDHDDHGYPKIALVVDDPNDPVFLGWATDEDILAGHTADVTLADVIWHTAACPEDCAFGQDGYESTATDVEAAQGHVLNQRAS